MFNSGNKPPLSRRLLSRLALRNRRTRLLYLLMIVGNAAIVASFFSPLLIALLIAPTSLPRTLPLILGLTWVLLSINMLLLTAFSLSYYHAAGRILGSSLCRMCGYDLEGVGDNPACPECGSDAGMMRATLHPDAGRRVGRDARICRVMIPISLVLSLWPILCFWFFDFMIENAPNDIALFVAFLTPPVIWLTAFVTTGRRIRNIARWRRYQSDMAREHADAAPV